MRINSIMPYNTAQQIKIGKSSVKKADLSADERSNANITLITFKGNNLSHDVKHGISVSVEDNIIGLPMYKCGGQGSVAAQLPTALNKHAGMRMAHVVPFYSYNNPTGGVKVLVIPQYYDLNNLPDKMPENLFLSYPQNKSLEEISKELNIPKERLKFVVQDVPQTVPNAKTYIDQITGETKSLKSSPYRILIPTNVNGTISRIDENSIGSLKVIPYKIFKMALPKAGGGYDTESVICVHTTDFARFEKAYTYSPQLKNHPHLNLYTRDFCDASVDMLPKLNNEEFNYFRPANIIAHCRTGFSTTESIINRSQFDEYFRGFIVDDIFHNPMENYQGTSSNPLEFLRYKATAEDFLKLSKLPEFSKIIDIDSHRNNLTDEESKIIDKIIRPFLQYYVDDNGNYNHSITPLIARKTNPENIFPNHVSHTFANEVVIYDDIARGLTGSFREAANSGDKIPGRPNGCNIDFMRINDPTAKMGNNALSEDLSWYHPYDTKLDTAEKIVEAKRANTKGFLNAIGKAVDTRLDKLMDYANTSLDDKLNQLFFSKDDIAKNKYVLGGLSKFHEKDILWASWGRSDSQKGYPILLEGFRKFLADETVPEEIRLHSKLLIGSGSDPWPVDDGGYGDFHKIKDTMYKIQTMDDGKYKLNVMYSNGGISNRLVTGATYTVFTSTGEPQGLTVPESLQSGTPSGSLNSGGAGEMIITTKESPKLANGFKTEHAYMQNLIDLEEQKGIKISGENIADVRLDASSDEVAKMFKEMALTYHEKPEVYKQMVYNAARSEFDWHNNTVLNKGRSTVELYAEDAFHVSEGWKGRNKNPLTRLVGEFGGKFEELKRTIPKSAEESAKQLVELFDKLSNLIKSNIEVVKSQTAFSFVFTSQKALPLIKPEQPAKTTSAVLELTEDTKDGTINKLQTEIKELANSNNGYKNTIENLKNSNKSLKIILGAVAGFLVASSGLYLHIHNKKKININEEIIEQSDKTAKNTSQDFSNLQTGDMKISLK